MKCHDCNQEFDMCTGDFENSICPDCLNETNNIESKIYWIVASLIVLTVSMMPKAESHGLKNNKNIYVETSYKSKSGRNCWILKADGVAIGFECEPKYCEVKK